MKFSFLSLAALSLALPVYAPAATGGSSADFIKSLVEGYSERPAKEQTSRPFGGEKRRAIGDDDLRTAQCFADEGEVRDLWQKVFVGWMKSWEKRDPAFVNQLLSKDGSFSELNKRGKAVSHGPIALEPWAAGEELNAEKFREQVKAFLASYSHISDTSIQILGYKSFGQAMRKDSDLSIQSLELVAHLDVRGVKESVLRQDRADLRMKFSRVAGGLGWALDRVEMIKGESLQNKSPAFAENTSISGKIPMHLRREAIRRGGFALSVSDFDGDGNEDMYVGTHGTGQLLKGDGKGNFEKFSSPEVEAVTRVKSAIFADFFNTGRQDLLLVRFAFEETLRGKNEEAAAGLVFFRNQGDGTFKRTDMISAPTGFDYPMPAALADFDSDGLLDVYVGFPGKLDFTSSDSALSSSQKVKTQGLFFNSGKKLELQDALPEWHDSSSFYMQRVYPHSALATDMNGDGRPDLFIANDRGGASPAYVNAGKRTFFQANSSVGIENKGYAMGVTAGDFDNDGIMDLAISNVGFTASSRLTESCRINWGNEHFRNLQEKPLRLFKGSASGKYTEVTSGAGVSSVGDGLSGFKFLDYNGDGIMDIYVTNGLWSGSDKYQEISDLYGYYQTNLKKFDDRSSMIMEDRLESTQSSLMKALIDFRGDVLGGEEKESLSLGGFQRNRLFRGLGNGRFLEVGYLEGVDSLADGYMVASADLDGDNKEDLILRNGDPGSSDHTFAPVQVFLNRNKEGNKVLKVRLTGVAGNRDGVGATVSANVNGKKQVRYLLGNEGTVQSGKDLFFGLGKSGSVGELSVKWPSGQSQRLSKVKPGMLRVTEPSREGNR